MTITIGAYLKHRRTAGGLSIADVAGQLSTSPRLAEHARAEHLELIEADVQPISVSTVVALRTIYRFDIGVLVDLSQIQLGVEIPAPRLCRICSCSQWDACRHPSQSCGWVAADLCSFCDAAIEVQAA